jgi:hypothetical protein
LNSSFTYLIGQAIEAMNVPQFTEKPYTREPAIALIDAGGPGERVNLRDKPGLRDSAVAARLNHGAVVDILAETNETETVDNVTHYWYRVRGEEGEEGWIFGAYLGPA